MNDEAARDRWEVRFDDLVAGRGMLFPPPDRVLTATSASEVVPVLAEVDAWTGHGGWAAGYVAYEAAAGIDSTLPVPEPAPGGPPLAWFALCGTPANVPPIEPGRGGRPGSRTPWTLDWTDDEHHEAVTRVRAHIAAGETYQCNLTDRLRGQVADDLRVFYADLAWAQRGSYNAYLDLGTHVVVSASPELFFEWEERRLTTRPMKGTTARGRTSREDRRLARRLRSSVKERAENVMIVDLLRNDLSRVAVPGSVAVPQLFTVERYPTVWQMTSTVTASVPEHIGLPEVFRALFPCGSVTGAPKPRTMQIIRELEPTPRGVYCGAIGIVSPPGGPFPRARFSVAIRTAVVERSTGAAVYGTGGGVTWDSDPQAERAELRAKTAVLTGRRPDHALLEADAHRSVVDPGRLLEFVRRCSLHDEQMLAAAIVRGEQWVRWGDGQVAAPRQAWAELPFRLRAVASHAARPDGRCGQCAGEVWPCAMLRLLLRRWQSHSGFRSEWRG